MGRYRIARQIPASPEEVFRAFTDPALVIDWMDAAAIRDIRGRFDEPGATYTLVIEGPWKFRSRVIRVERPAVHEVAGRGLLGAAYRMVATLEPADGGTSLDLLTEYTFPFGIVGRWIDRRWLDRGTRSVANREVDRLVALVSDPTIKPRPKGASATAPVA
jgi:polyketide cyclase/dehydrase/lipid transport protein